jgi:hypothetical protein
MRTLTLLVALLLSGSSGFTVHTHDVISGGPISAPQARRGDQQPSGTELRQRRLPN